MLNPHCTKCELHKSADHVCMGGRGSDVPKVLFVGQNPDQDDDEAGRMFSGNAGKLLGEMVREYQIIPCRIANAVKCASPANREPNKTEIKACREYLEWEIERYNPKMIVALGNAALESLLGRVGVSFLSGQIAGQYEKIPVFAMFHPSFPLRSPSHMLEWRNHWVILQKLLSNKPSALDAFKRAFPNGQIVKSTTSQEEEWINSRDFNMGIRFAEVIMTETLDKVRVYLDSRIDKIGHDLKLMQKRALTKIKETREESKNGN